MGIPLLRAAIILGLPVPAAATAQDESPAKLGLTARWRAEQFLPSNATIELALSRPVRSPTERLALVIGAVDISAVLDVGTKEVRYRPTGTRLPPGDSDVTAYLVTAAGWEEIGRFPLKVRSRLGLDRGRIAPNIDLTSAGQVDQGGTSAIRPERRTYQDLTLRIGLESELTHSGWQLSTAGNALGVSQETQRLQWNSLERSAPSVDLSDYRVKLSRGGSSIAIGNLTAGHNPYLVNGFGSRGAQAGVSLGRVASIEAALVNGTNVVGWSNLLGLGQPAHRIGSATIGLELLPSRPGGLQISLSGVDGSVLPRSSFNQGAATDAEESRGLGAQVALSDAKQRIRFSGGIARSRFVNPIDPLLARDTALVAVLPTSRTARYGELSLQLLQGAKLSRSIDASFGVGGRHERVDPLYRSVGVSPQADLESNSLDLTGSLGALSLRGTIAGSRDNLAQVRSILTSRTRNASATAALPLGSLVKRQGTWYYPLLTYAWQRTRQAGDAIPENGDFSASHVPDQVSHNQSASLTWTGQKTSLSYRWNQSFQDNHQPGRERSDFRAIVHGISGSTTPSPKVTVTIDLSVERQKNFELRLTQRLERVGTSLRWQATRTTDLSGSLSQSWAIDPGADLRNRNTELQLEISQGVNLYRKIDGGTQGRLFLRWGRTRAARYSLTERDLIAPDLRWTLNAGGSFRLY